MVQSPKSSVKKKKKGNVTPITNSKIVFEKKQQDKLDTNKCPIPKENSQTDFDDYCLGIREITPANHFQK